MKSHKTSDSLHRTRSCWGLASSSLKQRALKTIRLAGPPGLIVPCMVSFMAAAGVLHTLLGHSAYGLSRWASRQPCTGGL